MKSLFLFLILLFTSTQFGLAEDFIVNSFPEEADVLIKNAKTGVEVKIGATPLKMPLGKLLDYTQERVFILVVKKHGHDDYRILMSNVEKSDVEINVKLEVDKDIKVTRELDNLVSAMFEVQRLIRIKNYDQAISLLNTYQDKYPHYSIVHELLGSAFYLKKDFRSALGAYRKAFSLNPDNMDAYRMKLYLEKSFNVAQVKN